MSVQECNCLAVRSAARHMTQFYDQLLAPTGLRATQFSILAALGETAPLTINGLAKVMVMDRTTLGRNVLPLERDGLIRIAPAAGDRRAKELHLTKAGVKRFQEALKAWSTAQVRFEERFGPKRSAELRALMRAVVATELEASPADTRD
ncbi:MAG TPA: MarR family transcriptional regulator [Dongiaceae bacterium]|nr:MarR family transcriptional regulator [Dongiaceae bacterium]